MKASEIKKGGKYIAKVSGNLVTVGVDEIRETRRSGRYDYSGRPTYRDAVIYDVTNLKTGRKTTFKSAAKFRRAVVEPRKSQTEGYIDVIRSTPPIDAQILDEADMDRLGEEIDQELADGVSPMPETLAQKIRAEINEGF